MAITKARKKYLATPARAAGEAVFVALVIALVSFSVSMLGTCEPIPRPSQWSDGAAQKSYMGRDFLKKFYCEEGEYNPLATLFFTPAEHAIKQARGRVRVGEEGYHWASLGPLPPPMAASQAFPNADTLPSRLRHFAHERI